jgi:hypothetical protein
MKFYVRILLKLSITAVSEQVRDAEPRGEALAPKMTPLPGAAQPGGRE